MINKENDGTLYPYDDLEEAKTNMGQINKILDDKRAINIAIFAPYDMRKAVSY